MTTHADEIIKVVATRGFIYEGGRTVVPADILQMTRKKAWGFISSGQAEFATEEAIKAVKDQLAAEDTARAAVRAAVAMQLTPDVIEAVKALLAVEASKVPAKTSKAA